MKKENKNISIIKYLILLAITLTLSIWAISYLLQIPQEPRKVEIIKVPHQVEKKICENLQDWKAKEEFYHCFSKDGRINYVVVKSPIYPTYLPVSGNERVDYYCVKIDVVNFIP